MRYFGCPWAQLLVWWFGEISLRDGVNGVNLGHVNGYSEGVNVVLQGVGQFP